MEKSSFFNSRGGDRRYKAEDWASYFASFIANGVMPPLRDSSELLGLQVVADQNMIVKVKAGKAWINGYFYYNTDFLNKEIDVADGVLNRIDRIVIQWNLTDRMIQAIVKKGTPGSIPKAPDLKRNADIYEIALADIYVGKGTTAITQAHITDQRLNTELCGVSVGIVQQIDTSEFDAQLKKWFEEYKAVAIDDYKNFTGEMETWKQQSKEDFDIWFEEIKGILSGDVAGNILNEINALKVAAPNATATYEAGTVKIITTPSNAQNIYFYAPSDFKEGDKYTLNGVPLTVTDLNKNPIYDAWKKGSPVSMIIKGTNGFFKAGGGGIADTLPPMVQNITAIAGNQEITVNYKKPVSDALAGVLVVYKTGGYPTKPTDGEKVDAGLSESVQIEGLKNGTDYYIRVFPYNAKKQYQTLIDGATTTARPSEGPKQVTNLQVTGSGANPVLTWKNPTDDQTYHETVVIQKENSAPTAILDGTEIYRGTGETVTASGLERLKNYYWGVFTVNAEGGTRGPITTEVYSFDFPGEPTGWSEVTKLQNSNEWPAPEDGWFKIVAVAKSGDGGRSGQSPTGDLTRQASGGSGGSGGIVVHKEGLSKGNIIRVSIDYLGDIAISVNGNTIRATHGGNGGNGIMTSGSSGRGGEAGTPGEAYEGNIQNVSGKSGYNGRVGQSNGATAGVSNSYEQYVTTSGYGEAKRNAGAGSGTAAYVVILRGNTNIPSPTQVSELSLVPRNKKIEANWKNSGDPEQAGTTVVINQEKIPETPEDGKAVDVKQAETYTAAELENGKPCYIGLFAYNAGKTKYSAVKADVEIPREVTWYDTEQELKKDLQGAEQKAQEATKQAEQAQEAIIMTRDFLPDVIALTVPQIYDEWNPNGILYTGKDKATEERPASIVDRNGKLYRCLQSHTSQENWKPEAAPSLWVEIADPAEEWPGWKQPSGAHDAYQKGEKVSHNGKHWISMAENNVWEPGVFGWDEVK